MEKHVNCDCEECRNDDGLSCGCAACARKKKSAPSATFWNEHGLDVCKIAFSALLLLVSVLFIKNNTANLIICAVAYAVCAYEIVVNCVRGIIAKDFLDENTLMFIASITAFCLGEFSEGVLIVLLYSLGELLEEAATDNSRKKIAGLSKLKCETARLITKAGFVDVPPENVEVGSLIEVRRGDGVPIDGILLGANCEFDMKAITGESKPYSVLNGENVYSGAVNLGDAAVIKTTKAYSDSTVERIISMVEGANAKKAKSQKFITSFAKIYTPLVVLAAVLVAFIPPIFDGFNFVKWIYKALSFLVISCPCALVISVPLGFFTGIGSLAKRGVLVKGSNCVDALSQVNVAAFDKTGTLTKGEFSVDKITVYGNYSERDLLRYVAAVESKSAHPIANAICSRVDDKPVAENVREIAGKGLTGEVEGLKVVIGNAKLMSDNGVEITEEVYAGTIVFAEINGVFEGKIYVCDTVKPEAKTTLDELKRLGMKTVMISGDNASVCAFVGKTVGADEVHSQLLPEEKTERLKRLRVSPNDKVLFAGDGINDAPSLALSDAGVAMGALGSEIAVESADVVIMDDDLSKIPYAIKKAKKVKRKVTENIVGSLAIKLAVMVLSVVVSLPVWVAMFADVGVMLLAVLNALSAGRS